MHDIVYLLLSEMVCKLNLCIKTVSAHRTYIFCEKKKWSRFKMNGSLKKFQNIIIKNKYNKISTTLKAMAPKGPEYSNWIYFHIPQKTKYIYNIFI